MERKLLQIAVAAAGLAGVSLGLTGVLFGTMYADLSGDVVMDSYVRFLKGMLLAIGLIYWSCIRQIEQRGDRISLVTFILVFATKPLLSHRMMLRLAPVCALAVALLTLGKVAQPVWLVLSQHLACLFVLSMACHGELAADRPSAARLTDFYLMMSLGGVLGGLFNTLVAPLLFRTAVEYPIAILAACALCPRKSCRVDVLTHRSLVPQPSKWWTSTPTLQLCVDFIWPVGVGICAWGMPRIFQRFLGSDISLHILALGIAIAIASLTISRPRRFVLCLASLFLVASLNMEKGSVIGIERSFFGIHRVVRNPDGPFNDIYHGTTVHGRQFIDAATGQPDRASSPLTYYTPTGPIGRLLIDRVQKNPAIRIDVVGLGVGSLAAYAQHDTQLTYFEIDPAVRYLARDSGYFSFLKSAELRGAKINIVMGDARLTLQQTPRQSCDILVIDAFCGDAIPMHLLTREALKIYLDRLAPDGLLAFHVSNMYLNLQPVLAALAHDANCTAMYCDDLNVSPAECAKGKSASQWIIIARHFDTNSTFADQHWQPLPAAPNQPVWTDDFSNILGIFRWK